MSMTIHEFCHDIAAFLSVAERKVTPQTDIYRDLGVAGDDGDDLILYLENRYNVKISNFDIGRYFGSEPCSVDILAGILVLPVKIILRIFGVKFPRETIPLTVEELFLMFQREEEKFSLF